MIATRTVVSWIGERLESNEIDTTRGSKLGEQCVARLSVRGSRMEAGKKGVEVLLTS